jgi:hypothetical protein
LIKTIDCHGLLRRPGNDVLLEAFRTSKAEISFDFAGLILLATEGTDGFCREKAQKTQRKLTTDSRGLTLILY